MAYDNEGGPAFPHDATDVYYSGMSLRDYFAGKALAIIAAIPVHETGDAPALAREAYKIADAMIAARDAS